MTGPVKRYLLASDDKMLTFNDSGLLVRTSHREPKRLSHAVLNLQCFPGMTAQDPQRGHVARESRVSHSVIVAILPDGGEHRFLRGELRTIATGFLGMN
jgi:hypothetical protein